MDDDLHQGSRNYQHTTYGTSRSSISFHHHTDSGRRSKCSHTPQLSSATRSRQGSCPPTAHRRTLTNTTLRRPPGPGSTAPQETTTYHQINTPYPWHDQQHWSHSHRERRPRNHTYSDSGGSEKTLGTYLPTQTDRLTNTTRLAEQHDKLPRPDDVNTGSTNRQATTTTTHFTDDITKHITSLLRQLERFTTSR